ncbi:MAG: ABC transporter permease [Leptolyngbyaceae cyanobacterium bins.349]|nr:ABC transporter permease [Leptolyngbyaceae cyanobacterium bins.349]
MTPQLRNAQARNSQARNPYGLGSSQRAPNDTSWLKVLCLLPALVYDGIFFLLPLLFLVWLGFWTTENYQAIPGFSLENYRDIFSQFFTKSGYAYAIAQSLWVASTTTVLAIALCYGFAFGLVFVVPERYQRLLLLLAIAPFWSSYILRLYAWQSIIAQKGLLNTILMQLGWIQTPLNIIYTQNGTRIGLIHYLAPIMILILYLVLRNIDRTLIAASRNLGATSWQTFWRVIFPLSKLGIVYSAVFGMIISLGDVLSGILLGGGTGRSLLGSLPLFSTMILNEYAGSTNLPRTSALATILIGMMVVVLVSGVKWAEER